MFCGLRGMLAACLQREEFTPLKVLADSSGSHFPVPDLYIFPKEGEVFRPPPHSSFLLYPTFILKGQHKERNS